MKFEFRYFSLTYINLISLLLIILPFCLISGPLLTDITLSLMGLLFIIISLKKKLWNYYKNIFFIIFVIWYFYLVIISIISNNIYLSLESSLFYFRFGFFALAVWYVLDNNKNLYKHIYLSITICLISLIVDGFIQFFFGYNIFGFPYNGDRVTSFFREEQVLGSYISRLLPIYFGLIFYIFKNSKPIIFFSAIMLILCDILIFISGERSAFFFLILFSFLLIIYSSNWKIRIATIFASILLIIVLSIFNQNIRDRMLYKTIYQTQVFSENPKIFSIQHQVIYTSAYRIFKDNYLTGIGPKLFREECKKPKYQVFTELDGSINGCQTHPHNTYIQLLAETGIIGTIPVVCFLLLVLYFLINQLFYMTFKKKKIYTDSEICFLIAILISLWPLIPTGNFFNNWLSAIYFLPLGFFLNFIDKKKHEY